MKYRLISFVFLFILIITIFGITPLEAQEQGPIIDMHLHANAIGDHPMEEPMTGFMSPESTEELRKQTLEIIREHSRSAVQEQVVKCQFTQSSSGLLTGQCHGIPSRPSMPDPNPVDVELRSEDGEALTWTGTMEIHGTGYNLEVAPYEYADTTMHVVRTIFGWFIPSTLDLQGSPPELAFSLDAAAPPSQTDTEILARARELLSNEEAWNRADDRECSPSDTTYSLYCALAEATRLVTGDYQHRQPALQVVRRVVADEWPERIETHRLMDFNNDPRTTHDDLMRAFDLSEERLRDSHGLPARNSTAPEPTLFVEGGRVIVGNGTVLEEASVVISGDSILSVTEEEVEARGAQRIDASGKTVLPGLIDAHVHLIDTYDSTAAFEYREEELPGVLRSFLENGVTTVRAMGDHWPWISEVRDRVAMDKLQGPRIVTAGPVVMPEIPHPVCRGSSFCESRLTRKVADPEKAREVVRTLADEGVDFVKVISDARVEGGGQKPAVIEALVDQAHREGLRAVGHVDSVKRIQKYARMGMDGFAHLPRDEASAHQPRRLGRVLAEHGTPLTPTLLTGLPNSNKSDVETILTGGSTRRDSIETRSKHAAILAESGVPIAVGSDWYYGRSRINHPAVGPGRATITEMNMMSWGGMPREAIIKAATVNAAEALEMGDQVGTLERGKLADLIVVDGNPLEDLSVLENVEMVIQGGKIVTSNSE